MNAKANLDGSVKSLAVFQEYTANREAITHSAIQAPIKDFSLIRAAKA